MQNAIDRPKAFALLDAFAGRSLVWVCGAPGTGKTTLVRTYLRNSRGELLFWLNLDAGDGDPASFFHYLAQSVEHSGCKMRRPLPNVGDSSGVDLEDFGRRFFRQAFNEIRKPWTLVLDRYDSLPADSAVHCLLTRALEEMPATGRVMVTSRYRPPSELVRLQAGQRVAVLEGAHLRFSSEELATLSRSREGSVSEELQGLWRDVDGWPLAASLILEQSQTSRSGASVEQCCDAIYAYLTTEAFQVVTPSVRSFLLKTAFLPGLENKACSALTGDAEPGKTLHALSQHGFFVTRDGGTNATYAYHPLFRRFLQHRAAADFNSEELQKVQDATLEILERSYQIEQAANLCLEQGRWDRMEGLLVRHASGLIAEGREPLVRSWLLEIAPDRLENSADLQYWLGKTELANSPARARGLFEKAYSLFTQRGETCGQLSCVAAILHTASRSWADSSLLDRWMRIAERLYVEGLRFSSIECESRVVTGLLTGLLYRRNGKLLARVLPRAESLLTENSNKDIVLCLAVAIAATRLLRGEHERMHSVIARIDALGSDGVPAETRILVASVKAAYLCVVRGQHLEAELEMNKGRELAGGCGEKVGDTALFLWCMAGQFYPAKHASTHALAELLNESLSAADSTDGAGPYYFCRGVVAAMIGDSAFAGRDFGNAIQAVEAFGPSGIVDRARLGLALVRVNQGTCDEARQLLSEVRNSAEFGANKWIRFCWGLMESYIAFRKGEVIGARRCLAETFALGAEERYKTLPGAYSDCMLPYLCARALEFSIEPQYTRLVISSGDLDAPRGLETESWPWSVKIYTMGRFDLIRNGEVVQFSGKVQQKPLELLKALISFGGLRVNTARLIQALWPQADGDMAENSFNTTMYRLRKLVGSEAAIEVTGGRVSLNPKVCWVDVWDLERRLAAFQFPEPFAESMSGAQESALEGILRLYRGHFLEGEAEQPYVLPMRHRIRSGLMRCLIAAGQVLEHENKWGRAIHLYERGLEVDSLEEEFYRRLIECYRRTGRHAAAINTFRRCRELLSVVLGIQPSRETEALAALARQFAQQPDVAYAGVAAA